MLKGKLPFLKFILALSLLKVLLKRTLDNSPFSPLAKTPVSTRVSINSSTSLLK